MRVLQFAFGAGADHPFLPHNYPENCCVYTGTHDNDTAAGWWHAASGHERAFAARYLDLDEGPGRPLRPVHWALIRAACASVARLAVYQLQDVLGLGSEHRMNTPSQIGCWTWRFDWDMVGPEPARRLAELCACYGRATSGFVELPALSAVPVDPR
jgi:4-alpha-glucanotransferase